MKSSARSSSLRIFLSTLSLRRATYRPGCRAAAAKFLSTLSLRRATEELRRAVWRATISIHALLAESDNRDIANSERKKDISIHALLAESDISFSAGRECDTTFLSTLSLRRATRLGLLGWLRVLISIHALLAESDYAHPITIPVCVIISIHALLAESDNAVRIG